uniref:Uncharacterized protein n=1 Tax=Sinocyclocheilus anshuiensis TaxID=1608454 RepID=A0A671K916_9TELE
MRSSQMMKVCHCCLMLQDNEDQKGIEQLVMAVIVTKKGTSIDSPKDIGIIIKGEKVVTSLEGVPRACYVLLGLTYALNLHYPRHLKYTLYYFLQCMLHFILRSNSH